MLKRVQFSHHPPTVTTVLPRSCSLTMTAVVEVKNSAGDVVSQELIALFEKCKIPIELRTILTDKDFVEVHDITLLGESEKEVVEAIKGCIPSGSSLSFDLTLTKNIKKVWQLACAAAPKSGPAAGPSVVVASVDDDAPLPDGVPEAIEKAWVAKHGFHLSGARLLVGSDYNRVYNCLNKKKPMELPKMDPQKFRLQNEGVTGESKGLFLSEDGHVSKHQIFFCEIVAHDMLWWKIRAFLTTVCYLTVLRPGFFDFQNCEKFCDALHDVILAPTSNGNRLSLSQCKVAWMNMISDFHVKIFQTNCTLQSITSSDMAWKAHWAWHVGSTGSNSSHGGDGGNTSAIERRLQSMSDRIESQLGNNKKGKGGKGGRRGGKRFNQNRNNDKRKAGEAGFNKNIPPPPNKGNGGKSAGRNSFAKRAKTGKGGK